MIRPSRTATSLFILPLLLACGTLVLPIGRDGPDAGHDAGDATSSCLHGCFDAGDARDARLMESSIAIGPDTGISAQVSCLKGSGWSWCYPQPTGVTLDAVWGNSGSDVWAVGAGGVAEHWNGSAWSVVPTPTTLELFSVWGSASADVWAVGSNALGGVRQTAEAIILHWDGQSWRESPSPLQPGSELWSVWGSDATHVWAVGGASKGGLLMQWDGMSWSSTTSTQATVLRGVWGSSAESVWAVGSSDLQPDAAPMSGTVNSVPKILNWNGQSWALSPLSMGAASTALPVAVWGSGPADVWVATGNAPLHLQDGAWVTVPFNPGGTTAAGPTDFWGTAESGFWGTLGQQMVQWSGSTWEAPVAVQGIAAAGGAQPMSLSSVWVNSPSDAWAVGTGGALVHFDGAIWSSQSVMTELLSAWANSPTDAWAVGNNGTALHWTDGAWTPTFPGTTETITAVWGASPSDVWALADNSTLLQWGGSAWTTVQSPTPDPLQAIGGASATDFWISNGPNDSADAGSTAGPTNHPLVIHETGPIPTWTSALSPGDCWIEAFWANATTNVWAVGKAFEGDASANTTGVVAQYDGVRWTVMTPPRFNGPATDYTAVWGSGPDDVWVTGSAMGNDSTAIVVHWDGTTWTDRSISDLSGAGAIWGSGATDVWMWAYLGVAAEQSVLHWQDSTTGWTTALTLPDAWSAGQALTGTGPNDLWAVGSGGMILHHQ